MSEYSERTYSEADSIEDGDEEEVSLRDESQPHGHSSQEYTSQDEQDRGSSFYDTSLSAGDEDDLDEIVASQLGSSGDGGNQSEGSKSYSSRDSQSYSSHSGGSQSDPSRRPQSHSSRGTQSYSSQGSRSRSHASRYSERNSAGEGSRSHNSESERSNMTRSREIMTENRSSTSRGHADDQSQYSRDSRSYSNDGSRRSYSKGSNSQGASSYSQGESRSSYSKGSRSQVSHPDSQKEDVSVSRGSYSQTSRSNCERGSQGTISKGGRSQVSRSHSKRSNPGSTRSEGSRSHSHVSGSFSKDERSRSNSRGSRLSHRSHAGGDSRSLQTGSTRSSQFASGSGSRESGPSRSSDEGQSFQEESFEENVFQEESFQEESTFHEDSIYRDAESMGEKSASVGEEIFLEDDDSTFLDESLLDDNSSDEDTETVATYTARTRAEQSTSEPDKASDTGEKDASARKEAEERFDQSFQGLNDNSFRRPSRADIAASGTQDGDMMSQPKSQSSSSDRSPEPPSGGSSRHKSPKSQPKATPKKGKQKPGTSSTEMKMQIEPVVKVQKCKSMAILGTMSDAGKSVITAGLCRVLSNNGMRVAPFKGQHMSNNASPALMPDEHLRKRLYKWFKEAVGGDFPESPSEHPDHGYGEIGTAQYLQAEACRVVPRVDMNPVLLKSCGQNEKEEHLCSVVVLGKQVARETYGVLGKRTTALRTMVLESHQALAEATDCEVILMEGAGGCTELNLMERDIVNLPLVRSLACPWLLVANVDCGGVFAQIVGTKMCVSKRDWSLCAGVIVNKLRGEGKDFEPGQKMIEDMVGKPVFVVPFLNDLNLPEEDGSGIERRIAWEAGGHHPEPNISEDDKKPVVVVIAYPHTAISNDICPLEADPRFEVQWRSRRVPRPYPHTTSVILPGSQLTRKDLKWLHDSGWATFLRKHVAAGGNVLGLCGGYQMLGWSVNDPTGVEGTPGKKQGLGLLPIRTTIAAPKVKNVAPRQGKLFRSKTKIQGFELHCGQSEIVTELGESMSKQIHPLVIFDDLKPEGMCAGRVRGTYMHGILWSAEARVQLLVPDPKEFPALKHTEVQDPLDRLAVHLESCGLDVDTLKGMMAPHRNK